MELVFALFVVMESDAARFVMTEQHQPACIASHLQILTQFLQAWLMLKCGIFFSGEKV